MNAHTRNLSIGRPGMLGTIALGVAVFAAQAGATATVAAPVDDDQAMVECRLPPQIRTIGREATYLAGGRTIRASVAECKVRGGSYHGQGPGALAGRGSDAWAARTPVAVIVGGDKAQAACPRTGVVGGLSGRGTLSVRTAPSVASKRIDGLTNGEAVFMCDWSVSGEWVGVVYSREAGTDCGVSKYILLPQPYAGTCRSGWVSSKYVK